ncbi:MAG: bacteriocin [Bryobacteraceae bacterium]
MADELGEVNDPTKPDENTITELKEEELKSVSGGLTNATISLTNATISRDI